MKLNSEQVAYTREIAFHEAGHHVAARVKGFDPGFIKIAVEAIGHHRGMADVGVDAALASLDDVRSFCERRVVMLFSGSIAETLPRGSIDKTFARALLKESAANDSAKIRELVRVIAFIELAGDTPSGRSDRVKEVDDRLFNEAVALVNAEKTVIADIASLVTSRVVKFRKLFMIPLADIDDLKSVKERFSV